MIFSSYEFIFIFFPIVIIGYFLLSKIESIKVQHLFLVIVSLIFYAWFNPSYIWIIIASIIINYAISKWMTNITKKKELRKIVFILGIIFNILLIGYFKYYNFFIENINVIFKSNLVLKNILLPLGISFFTFQQVSFLLSIYRGEERISDFIEYCLFVSFFPQLVAGPIVLYSEMMPQFKDKSRRYVNWDNIAIGIYIFVIGLFKKIVIADTLAIWVDNGFTNSYNMSFFVAWATSIAYTLQIYFDFSGYSDMAIGLGRMLNIDLPINFNSPYKSENIGEFWRRWHITLGRALSEYIYKPLGGNRKGEIRTYINLIATFFISGLWHGASWLFIIWGLLHGVASIIQRLWRKTGIILNKRISIFITFMFVNFTWVIFRAENISQTTNILKSMIMPKSFNLISVGELFYDGIISLPLILCMPIILITLIILLIIIFKAPNTINIAQKFKADNKNIIFTSILFFISIICLSRASAFIYFNF